MSYVWVAIGSALGGVMRYWLSGVAARCFGDAFPWGTLIVNVTGSFVIGFVATLIGPNGRWLPPSAFRPFFLTGVCGGYTTFSSFSIQTLDLAREGQMMWAGANVLLSVACCLAAVWLGHVAALSIATRS